jgi:hypothetical protein
VFRVIMDFEEFFVPYYGEVATVVPNDDVTDSFEHRLVDMSSDELACMASNTVANMLCHGQNLQMSTGVSYVDIANLKYNTTVREIMCRPGENTMMVWRPTATVTQQYHLDLMEDQLCHVIEECFGGSARGAGLHTAVSDSALWRLLTGMVIDIAGAIANAGHQVGLNDIQQMGYHIESTLPQRFDPYTYVLTLKAAGE